MHLFHCKISTLLLLLLTIFSDTKTVETCDVRIQLYWECTHSTLVSIVLGNLFALKVAQNQENNCFVFI